MSGTRLWRNARLATLDPARPGLGEIAPGAVAAENDRIAYAGPESELPPTLGASPDAIDCEGRWITPGLIDCHTHLIYAGDRANEFEQRLAGATYEQIARAGGGILASVRAVRSASEDELIRPVDWLLNHVAVDARWCIVHATHMNDDELGRLAASGATVGLCPITEANLGDGVFRAREFLDSGGVFGIGTDSNLQISLPAELRQLEYSQRLLHRSRNILAPPNQSTGQAIFEFALRGARALGTTAGLKVGHRADFVSLRTDDAAHFNIEQLLDAWIFPDLISVDCVWCGGRKLVNEGRHIHRDLIFSEFRKTMAQLHTNQ